MAKVATPSKLNNRLIYLTAVLLVLLPLHATLTVWLASNFGHYTLFRLWIEVIIAVVAVGAVYLALQEKATLKGLQARWLWWLSVVYVVLHLVLGIVALARHQVNAAALGDGLVLNLRPIVMFWAVVMIASRSRFLHKQWTKLLLIPAAIVVLFGLLQHFVLPVDFLRHVGYGPKTIAPYETVDQKLAYVRVQSTLRGPNPLGAYVVVIVAALAALMASIRKPKARLRLGVYTLATLIVLFYSYSRSALLGTLLAVSCIAWLAIRQPKIRRLLVMLALSLAVFAAFVTLALQHNSRFDNIFFHTDKTSHSSISSNQNHVSALESGLKDIEHNPFGDGPGTAGPASVHNNHSVRLAEDYYVQLGQEVGVLGAAIFIAINVLIGIQLWRARRDPLALALLASLLGLTFVNLFSHAWTDDTLAVLWWSLAAVALTSDILKTTKHETAKA
jgi:O-antigen ligase/polysaccharide polymerase Wzy-like membrane protein